MNGQVDSDHSQSKKARVDSELEKFDEVFPELVELLVNPGLKDSEIQDANKWFREVLEYNVPHGKKNRGMFVVMAYRFLVQNPMEEDIRIARILGWCIEMLQAFFLVADDIMDQSYTRRGKPCWFRKETVGLEAVNDSVYLESCIYKVLKHYIKDRSYYINILELFHEPICSSHRSRPATWLAVLESLHLNFLSEAITHYTITGQCLDMTVSPPAGTVDFTNYTLDKYNAIVKWKTAFYSFYLPVAAAMYMAGISDDINHSCAKTILLKMGEYFQVQDDYLDCYGDEAVIGKIGTDIQDNKCSWLVVTALQISTPEQVAILKENYGSSEQDKVERVKLLYKELNLEQAFRDFEEQSFQEILTLIEKGHGDLPQELFKALVQKIYKRNK